MIATKLITTAMVVATILGAAIACAAPAKPGAPAVNVPVQHTMADGVVCFTFENRYDALSCVKVK